MHGTRYRLQMKQPEGIRMSSSHSEVAAREKPAALINPTTDPGEGRGAVQDGNEMNSFVI